MTVRLILLIGDIGSSNNVAFTEAYRRRRAGTADLWILGHDSETARRAASRVITDVKTGLAEALSAGPRVAAWVNPESAPAGCLDALLPVREKLEIQLFWSSRNAGYLFTRQTPVKGKPDLYLDVGVEEATNGAKRIAFGKKRGDESIFIPLSRDAWIHGRSYPTGMPPVSSGLIDIDELKKTAALIQGR